MTTFKCIIDGWEDALAPDAPAWEQAEDVEADDEESAAQRIVEASWNDDPREHRDVVVHVKDEDGNLTVWDVYPHVSVDWLAHRRES